MQEALETDLSHGGTGRQVRKITPEYQRSFDFVAQLGKRVMYHEDTSVEAVINRLKNFCDNPEEVLNLLLEYDLVEFEQETPCYLPAGEQAPLITDYGPYVFDEETPVSEPNPLDILVSVSRFHGFYIDSKTGEKKAGQGVFNKGIFDHMPLRSIINLISSDYFRPRTEAYRANPTKKFKDTQFCYATFSGTFHYANDNEENRITHSGMICIDLDKLIDPKKVLDIISVLPGYVFTL